MLPLSPQCFAEITTLGIFWEYWPPQEESYTTQSGKPATRLITGYATADHVLRVLCRLEAIPDAHLKTIQHTSNGEPYQRKLLRHCGVCYGKQYVTNSDSWLFFRGGSARSKSIDLVRLVRVQPLALLPKGAEVAPTFETKYAHALTKEAYLNAAAAYRAEAKTE